MHGVVISNGDRLGARLAPGSFAWLLPMEPPRPPSVREVLAFYRQQVGQGDGPRLRVDRAPPEFCWAAPIHAKRCGRSVLVGSDKDASNHERLPGGPGCTLCFPFTH